MENTNHIIEEEKFIKILNETYNLYFKHGARSSKKVDYFHQSIKEMLTDYFKEEDGYDIELEYNIKSCNSTKKKKCDIVILKSKEPYIIIPVKVIMTNYKQNKNNSWENLTGELSHIKWMNPDIYIIPINIFMDKTPYLKSNKEIKKFEKVTNSDIENYQELITHNLCYDLINYIVEVEHSKKENELFDELLPIKKLNSPYRNLTTIFQELF